LGLAALDREADILRHHPATEGDGEILDLEQGQRLATHAIVFRGSKASRIASPVKTSRVSMVPMTMKPVVPSQGACRFSLPCCSSSPSEGEPGGKPKPRKSSAVSVVTDPLKVKGRKVSVATRALGRMCLVMMRQ